MKDEIHRVLSAFPKRRPGLPPEYAELYADYYRDNRQGRGVASLSKRLEGWMHRKAAADIHAGATDVSTLEIGAGTLNHLDFEPNVGSYDIVEPMPFLYDGSRHLPRVRSTYADTADISLVPSYERIVSIATFEHICDLPAVVARIGLLLLPGGRLRVGIPSEGTPLWALGWRLTTGLEFRLKRHLDYGVIMRHEHVNSAAEVVAVLSHFFGQVTRTCFGVGNHLSLYQYVECHECDRERCVQYLEQGADAVRGDGAPG